MQKLLIYSGIEIKSEYNGINNIAGGSNVFIGNEAGSKNSLTRYWNTYVGTAAGMEATGAANAFFGYGSSRWISMR